MKTERVVEAELNELDAVFARFMQDLSGSRSEALYLAAALVSSDTRNGHICIQLSDVAGRVVRRGDGGHDTVVCPEAGSWRACLESADVVGRPGDYRPMILDDKSRLYLYRYWKYEQSLIDRIRRRVTGPRSASILPGLDAVLLKDGLSRLFLSEPPPGVDWRAVAAVSAVLNSFTVISGSPGTGKTTTVAKILALLLEQTEGKPLRIALAAPTGKAAVRLQEAVGRAKEKLACSEDIRSAIPDKTSTVHRLLGTIPRSPYFRHNAGNPLPYDVVVVDEASMIALPLFSKLVEAVRPEGKIIVLGDKDQLASVEAGAVLGDICGSGNPNLFSRGFADRVCEYTAMEIGSDPKLAAGGLRDGIVSLEQNFRYGESSGIARLSKAVNNGDGIAAWDILRGTDYQDVRWAPLPQAGRLQGALQDTVGESLLDYYKAVEEGLEPFKIFERFETFRILCALRQGRYGVVGINDIVEDMLRRMHLIPPETRYYPGKPVMVTRNDYQMALFNGDIGIMVRDPDAPEGLQVAFRDAGGGIRIFHPLRLPEHETAYAMTVHKSQGSEYDRILILFPERDNPVLTRELIYTAVTRAKIQAELWSNEAVFRAAAARRIERTSGLRDALWGEDV
jgi:exodeoxyribonuclease V alpha subunit